MKTRYQREKEARRFYFKVFSHPIAWIILLIIAVVLGVLYVLNGKI
ncbi:MAG: hypothetical protein ACTJHC_08820 [Vagococcus sp.]